MKVSLIIPTYNRAHLIGETLNSVLNQSYTNWECIIVDDGSDDNTEEVVNGYIKNDSRFSYHERPLDREKGANACRNFGFEQSSGDLINWLDSDDIITKDHFKIHVEKHKDVTLDCVVSGAKNFVKDPDEENGMWSVIDPVNEAWKDMIAGLISWATPSTSWKKEVLPLRPYHESLQDGQEWYFHIIMLLKGVKYFICMDLTICVRRHEKRIGTSMGASKFKSKFLSRLNIFKALYSKSLLTKEMEYHLLKVMFKALYKSTCKRFIANSFYMSLELMKLLKFTSYKLKILKLIFIGVSICFITRRGEVLFKLVR